MPESVVLLVSRAREDEILLSQQINLWLAQHAPCPMSSRTSI